MLIQHLSDIHDHFKDVIDVECDLLIFSGDWSYSGRAGETKNMIKWLEKHPAKEKVFIAGNHEFTLCEQLYEYHKINNPEHALYLESKNNQIRDIIAKASSNIHYLEDESITLFGYKIYGTPWSTNFPVGSHKWGFNKYGEEQEKSHMNSIPDDTEILITHEPPYGILDLANMYSAGNTYLKSKIFTMKDLVLHCFGHIHKESYDYQNNSLLYDGKTTFSNGSMLTHRYNVANTKGNLIILKDKL